MLHRLCRSYREQRRGAAAVEFAVVAPVFILLVLGMLEYGRMIMVQQVITNASREGARRAVLDGATVESVTAAMTSYLNGGTVSGATLTITPDPATATAGTGITVKVSVDYSKVQWLPFTMFLGAAKLEATTTMRRETSA
jgi:Flp pilus assembly protein TadG